MTCPQMGCWLAKHGCDTKLYCAPTSQFFAILTSSSMAVARASRWGRWGSRRGRQGCWGRAGGGRRSSWCASVSGQLAPSLLACLLARLCLPGKSRLDWHRPAAQETYTQTYSIYPHTLSYKLNICPFLLESKFSQNISFTSRHSNITNICAHIIYKKEL